MTSKQMETLITDARCSVLASCLTTVSMKTRLRPGWMSSTCAGSSEGLRGG